MFCPKCGSILVPRKEDSKKMLVCSCGYKTAQVVGATIRETIPKTEKDVEVIDKGELQTLPKTTAECPNAAIGQLTSGWCRQGQATSLKPSF